MGEECAPGAAGRPASCQSLCGRPVRRLHPSALPIWPRSAVHGSGRLLVAINMSAAKLVRR